MNKKALLACLLAVMMLLSSCSLIVKDAAVDAATEIVRVGEDVFTKGDVQLMVTNYLASMQNYYAQNYGYSIDVTSESAIAEAQDQVINSLIENSVITAKEKELGLYELPADKQAEVDDLWAQYTDLVKNYFLADTELEGEELENTVAAYVYNAFGATKESLEASQREQALWEHVVADVTVSDEEVQTAYDAKVEAAKSNYEINPNAFGTDMNNGATVYYRPAGYRMVKSILLKFQQADSDRIAALNTKANEQGTAATAKLAEINAMEAVADQDVPALCELVTVEVSEAAENELTAVTADTLPADLDADLAAAIRDYQSAVALKAAYEQAKAAAVETAYQNLDAAADDILAQLDAGADWNALQAEKTEDPGMQSGITAERGYAVREGFTSFDSAYVEAAMALANVGDHSGKVRSDNYGYFIISYAAEVVEGPVALEDVKDAVQNEALSAKKDAKYNETVAQWVSEAKAVVDKKALND